MGYYIYMTTNLINNKKYIGQHKGSIKDNYLGSGILLKKAIEKYGEENFKKEILCQCSTREEADKKEKEYISLYNAVNNKDFYNLAEGGSKGDGWRACKRYFQANPQKAQEVYKKNGERLQNWKITHPEEYKEKALAPFLAGSKRWRESHLEEVALHMKKVQTAKEKWQKEHKKEYQEQVEKWRKAGSEANSQKIRCITTNEIFPSQCAAARHYNISQTNISKCIHKERYSAGRHPETGEKLRWELVE